MATFYGGIGDTSMNNPESQDMDSDSQENYQEEHVKLDHPSLTSTLNLQNGFVETNCQRQG